MSCKLNLDTILTVSNDLRTQGKRVVFTHGAYDLYHIGHSEFLKESKLRGDYLVVGIESDKRIKKYKSPTRPIIPLEQRSNILLDHKEVDFVLELDYSDEMTERFYFDLYQKLNPRAITWGRFFGMEKAIRKLSSEFVGTDFHKIYHKYDNVQSTTKVIEKIQNL